MEEKASYFKPGGTLSPDSSSYLTRSADDDIFRALESGEYVFVLDSRQKGKSSLIAHAVVRLRDAGIATAKIDLQRLGANLNPDQWYAGLLHGIGQDLGLWDELFEHWKQHTELGPLSRWLNAITEVALKQTSGKLIIFIDEVDFVQALKFSSGEFFAGIRSCYNRRAENDQFSRLSFCLVGVATPSQLIDNDEVTPFNVGHRVELKDFSRAEIEPYAAILSANSRDGNRILDRIFDWVSGHPYLTQLLASKVASDDSVKSRADVDRIVKATLLTAEARQSEPNLADVERRLLRPVLPNTTGDEARSRVLDLYRSVLEGKAVPFNYEDPLIACVLLSGVAKVADGHLVIRNRAYRYLFDHRWYRSNLPDAEARRLARAASRAAWRVGWIAIGVFSVIFALLGWSFYLASQRDHALRQSRQLNNENQKIAYQASMVLASKEAASGNWLQVGSLIDSQKNSPFRGWEWTLWNTVLSEPKDLGISVEKNRDGGANRVWIEDGKVCTIIGDNYVADGKVVGTVNSVTEREWIFGQRQTASLESRISRVNRLPKVDGLVALTNNLDRMVIRNERQTLECNAVGGTRLWTLAFSEPIMNCSVSGNDRMFFVTLLSGSVVGINAQSGKRTWSQVVGRNHGLISSPDGRKLLVAKDDRFGVILNGETGAKISDITGHVANITFGCWFRDSSQVVTASADGTVCIWRATDGYLQRRYVGFRDNVLQAVLTPDEKSIICVLGSGAVMSVGINQRVIFKDLMAHSDQVQVVQFSPRGLTFATASIDGLVVLWDRVTQKPIWKFEQGPLNEVVVPQFSNDGNLVALVTARHARILNAKTGRCEVDVSTEADAVGGNSFVMDGRLALPLEAKGVGLIDGKGAMSVIAIPGMNVAKIATNADGSKIYAISGDAQLDAIDVKTSKSIAHRTIGSTKPKSLTCSPDGKLLAIGSYDSNVYLVDLTNDLKVRALVGHTSRVFTTRFSPDGLRLLTNSADTTARLFDVKSGQQLGVMRHGSWVSSADWSPDGTRIITACDDGKVRIFDGFSGNLLSEIEGRSRTVFDARFSPDGRDLVTVGFDRVVRYWHPLRK